MKALRFFNYKLDLNFVAKDAVQSTQMVLSLFEGSGPSKEKVTTVLSKQVILAVHSRLGPKASLKQCLALMNETATQKGSKEIGTVIWDAICRLCNLAMDGVLKNTAQSSIAKIRRLAMNSEYRNRDADTAITCWIYCEILIPAITEAYPSLKALQA